LVFPPCFLVIFKRKQHRNIKIIGRPDVLTNSQN
jgi:hypothetical protein